MLNIRTASPFVIGAIVTILVVSTLILSGSANIESGQINNNENVHDEYGNNICNHDEYSNGDCYEDNDEDDQI